jgi:hypothetical protein
MTENENAENDNVYTMETGVRVRMLKFNPATLGEAEKQIKDTLDRTNAFMDIIAAMTIELVDELPEDDKWLKHLKLLEKIGRLDLSKFDLDDDIDLEFLFLKHKALSLRDWTHLFRYVGIPSDITDKLDAAFEGLE